MGFFSDAIDNATSSVSDAVGNASSSVSDAVNNPVGAARAIINPVELATSSAAAPIVSDPLRYANDALNNPVINPHSIVGDGIEKVTGISYNTQLTAGAIGGTAMVAAPFIASGYTSAVAGVSSATGLSAATIGAGLSAAATEQGNKLLNGDKQDNTVSAAPVSVNVSSEKSAPVSGSTIAVGIVGILLAIKFGM